MFAGHCCCNQDPCLARCTGAVPTEASVTVAGISCSTCTNLNTTYILPNPLANCGWPLSFDGSGCGAGFEHIAVALGTNVGQATIQVTLNVQGVLLFTWDTGPLGAIPIDCESGPWSAPLVSGSSTPCTSDGTPAIVTLYF